MEEEMNIPSDVDIILLDEPANISAPSHQHTLNPIDKSTEENSESTPKRFAAKSEAEIDELAAIRLAKGTKKVTNWGFGVFQGTSTEY